MRRLLFLVCLLSILISFPRVGYAQDTQYLRIYDIIQDGDSLYSRQQHSAALAKYQEAFNQLQQFQRLYPDWNSNIIKYRLTFLSTVIAEISAKVPQAAATSTPTNAAPSTAVETKVSPEIETRIKTLQAQIQQLQSDNSLLESKLKEALRVQPASVDPQRLARADEEIRALQKENALLKVSLTNRPPAVPTVDQATVDQLKKQLAEANKKSEEANARAGTLANEKASLQQKLESLIPAGWNAEKIATVQKELEAANRKIAEQNEAMARLDLEKIALQERVKAMLTDAEVLAALKAENEVLKKQLAEAKAAPAGESEKLTRELTEAKALIAVLQSEQNVLRLEREKLEQKLKEAGSSATASADTERVKQLERERDDLQKKLDASQKEVASLKSRTPASSKVEELQNEIQILRTRLAVMETQKIPYTEEEAALIKKEEARLVENRTPKKSVRELPPGSAELVAAAQKDFAARRYDQAEEKYQQVLRKDENNVYTLANLAAIQIERNRYDEAEKNIKLALTNAPDDSYSLSLLGFLRFRQARYDDALDALGRAAKLDPQNAEIQNYLGLTLSQKGMRNAAESAFRRALVLDPSYGSAHYNMAVLYMTSNPELARMHYKKALAAGLQPSIDMERILNRNQTTP
jgi:Chromosome segregation ATPases